MNLAVRPVETGYCTAPRSFNCLRRQWAEGSGVVAAGRQLHRIAAAVAAEDRRSTRVCVVIAGVCRKCKCKAGTDTADATVWDVRGGGGGVPAGLI